MSRCPSSRRRPSGLAGLAVAFVLMALVAAPAHAGGSEDGRIALVGHLEPTDLAPGGSGFLVVTSKIDHHLHVYADGHEADHDWVEWWVEPTPGVTFEAPSGKVSYDAWKAKPGRVTWTEPKPWKDPNFPEYPARPIWEDGHDFTLRIPVTLDASTAPDARLVVTFAYSACDEMMCFRRVKEQQVVVELGAKVVAARPARAAVIGAPARDEAAEVSLSLDEKAGVAVVTFSPGFGYHLYMPGSEEGIPIEVKPLDDAGIRWGAVVYPGKGEVIHEPYEVRVPFQREKAGRLRLEVSWQGCNDMGHCARPQRGVLEATWAGSAGEAGPEDPMIDPGHDEEVADTEPDPLVGVNQGEIVVLPPTEKVPFPQVVGDDLGGDHGAEWTASGVEEKWQKSWLWMLLSTFGFGVLLAFTPCVLPIIPLTISVIGGGNPDMKKSRLTWLLTVYVLGLSLTYGAAGALSGSLGEAINVEAAFQNKYVVWGISIFFLLMGAGMLGIFELQPPKWMEGMRGGAARKSGTVIGSFLLGCLAAVIASPCTGPFVVALLTFVATTGNPAIGFLLFFALGLGMGAVFFAAGSLNLLARPGPWMVWVRYIFGILLFAVALHYLAGGGLLNTPALLIFGFVIALIALFAVRHHLVKKEYENPKIASRRSAVLAAVLAAVTIAMALYHRTGAESSVHWTKIKDLAHLQQEVEGARAAGKPLVVDIWATWCFYCKEYDKVIEGDATLREKLATDFVALKLDLTEDHGDEQAIRRALGLPSEGQPRMVFFDRQGRIRRGADVTRYYNQGDEDPAEELRKRVNLVSSTRADAGS